MVVSSKSVFCLTNHQPKDLRQFEECDTLCVRRVMALNNVMNRRSPAIAKREHNELLQAMVVTYMGSLIQDQFTIEMVPDPDNHQGLKKDISKFLEGSPTRDAFLVQYGYNYIGRFLLGIGNKSWPLKEAVIDMSEDVDGVGNSKRSNLEERLALVETQIESILEYLESTKPNEPSSRKKQRLK